MTATQNNPLSPATSASDTEQRYHAGGAFAMKEQALETASNVQQASGEAVVLDTTGTGIPTVETHDTDAPGAKDGPLARITPEADEQGWMICSTCGGRIGAATLGEQQAAMRDRAVRNTEHLERGVDAPHPAVATAEKTSDTAQTAAAGTAEDPIAEVGHKAAMASMSSIRAGTGTSW